MGPDTYNLLYNFCVNSPTLTPENYYKRLLGFIDKYDMPVVAELACLRTYGHRNYENLVPNPCDSRYYDFLEILEPPLTLALCNSDFEQ